MMLTNYVLSLDNATRFPLLVMALVKRSSMLAQPRLFLLIQGVECLFIVSSIFIFWYFYVTLSRRHLYHTNVLRVIMFNYISYYLTVTGRILTFLYEIEVLSFTGTQADWPLFLGTFLRLQFILVFVFLVPSITAERCIASYFIADYEQLNRHWISYVIITSTLFVSLGFVIPIMRGFFGVELFAVMVFLVALCAVLFVSVVKYNAMKLEHLNKHDDRDEKYSLSIRFQLAENVRTMRHLMIMAVLVTIAISVVLYFIGGAVIWNELESMEGQIMAALGEMSVSIAAVLIVASFEIINSQFQKGHLAIIGTKPSRYFIAEQLSQSKDDMTQIHFDTLSRFW